MTRVWIYDTTLRDGAQTEGISFSCEDKLDVLSRLDELGVDFVEGGWPGSNPRDDEFFERAGRMELANASLTAFGSTRRHGVSPEEDPNLRALAACSAGWCCIFGKSWDFHVTDALRIGLDDNLAMIEDSVRFLRESGKRVMFDAEHFFDGYFANRDYALAALTAAERGGAEWLVLCDTNGGTLPTDIAAAVEDVLLSTHTPLGIHCHNDSDLATACTLAAVEAGCTMVQGTVNGIGERVGNADLVIGALLGGDKACILGRPVGELFDVCAGKGIFGDIVLQLVDLILGSFGLNLGLVEIKTEALVQHHLQKAQQQKACQSRQDDEPGELFRQTVLFRCCHCRPPAPQSGSLCPRQCRCAEDSEGYALLSSADCGYAP